MRDDNSEWKQQQEEEQQMKNQIQNNENHPDYTGTLIYEGKEYRGIKMSVYKKLMDVRVEFNSMEIKKSGLNKFAGYKYFELGDFLPVAQMLFNKNGLCGFVSFGIELAELTIVDVETEKFIVIRSPMSTAALKGCHDVQNLGAVQTYLRRYLWTTALELAEHDAIDSSEPTKKDKVEAKIIKPTEGVFEALDDGMKQAIIELAIQIEGFVESGDVKKACENYRAAYKNDDGTDDQEIQVALWSKLPSNVRSSIKKFGA